jgi:DNA repair exonuclease SbcCD ATPase subunit
MADVTSDYSKILELQEVKRHYDDLQRTHTEDIASRDQVIADLRRQIEQAGSAAAGTAGAGGDVAELQAKNAEMAKQVEAYRKESEAKVQRLETRVRDLTAKLSEEPAPEPARRGLFRR